MGVNKIRQATADILKIEMEISDFTKSIGDTEFHKKLKTYIDDAILRTQNNLQNIINFNEMTNINRSREVIGLDGVSYR